MRNVPLRAVVTVAIVSAMALSGCSKSKKCGCLSGIGVRVVDTALFNETEGWNHIPISENYQEKTIEEGKCSDLDYDNNSQTPDSLMNEYGFVTVGYMECHEK